MRKYICCFLVLLSLVIIVEIALIINLIKSLKISTKLCKCSSHNLMKLFTFFNLIYNTLHARHLGEKKRTLNLFLSNGERYTSKVIML